MSKPIAKMLDIGCGRNWYQYLENRPKGTLKYNIVCVDRMFASGDTMNIIYPKYENRIDKKVEIDFYDDDIFEFLEKYPLKDFTDINMERVAEHIPYEKLHYLFYLLFEVSKPTALLTIIVPDFSKIVQNFDDHLETVDHPVNLNTVEIIRLHTEIFNEKHDPHLSFWNRGIAKYWLELEGYWKITQMKDIKIDGRYYLQIFATNEKNEINEYPETVE